MIPGLGAFESTRDSRTVPFETTLAALLDKGGYDYLPEDIEHQWKVGICTAIHLIQERQKANGKKYSSDFQYLLQKKYYDGNWTEGSSILHALKVGKRFGFLPREQWTHTTEADRKLTYSQYIAKLKAISEEEINRLIELCVDKIPGYTQVDVNNPMAMAKAINESQSGILCRFEVGKEWFKPDTNPLTPPVTSISGHGIIQAKFNYETSYLGTLPNTWGSLWADKGKADYNWSNYRPTEAWIVVSKVFFVNDLKLGMTHPDVKRLQVFLNTHQCIVSTSGNGSPGNETDYFGEKTRLALVKFQKLNGIQPAVGYFGSITRAKVNSIL